MLSLLIYDQMACGGKHLGNHGFVSLFGLRKQQVAAVWPAEYDMSRVQLYSENLHDIGILNIPQIFIQSSVDYGAG